MLGYGESDKPDEPEEYSLKMISGDLASILDVILVRKVVSVDEMEPVRLWEMTRLLFIDRDRTRLGVAHCVEICPVVSGKDSRGGAVSGRLFYFPCS